MLLDHEKNALCDGYMDESIHDATKNYYDTGTYDSLCSCYVSIFIFYASIIELIMPSLKGIKKALVGRQPSTFTYYFCVFT